MGIESKAFEIGTGGALIKGKNRSGKTSIMQAFVSALTGVGIDSNHIRAGADRAEILIDFADPVAQARRIARRLIGTRVEAGEMVIELLEAA
jgi:DNA repair exonuclease SbcCD ATPase subunit